MAIKKKRNACCCMTPVYTRTKKVIPVTPSYILMETGDYILMETGDKILTE